MNKDLKFMQQALEEAKLAFSKDEVPIGAIAVADGKVIGRGHNLRELYSSPLAHAEIIAIHRASEHLQRWILDDVTLYVTVEPCMMCAGAILNARIKRVVYGAPQEKFGSLGGVINLLATPTFNHQVEITNGILADEAAQLMKDFFKSKRKND